MAVVNVAEEVLSGVLQAAEHLQGAVLAAETGAVESLRWAGAMPLLLRDLNVSNIIAAEELLDCATAVDLRCLLLLDEQESAGHIAVVVSGFLWDYEAKLKRLLSLGVVRTLTVCSSLSERAHECFDFSKLSEDNSAAFGAKATKSMKFEEFADELQKKLVLPDDKQDGNVDEEEWGWTEDDASEQKTVKQNSGAVQVLHLPLNVVPLLSSRTLTPEPSVFVLSHPTCAAAFPLLLHQVEDVNLATPTSPTGRTRAGSTDGVNKYSHVKDVLPEHIPSAFRRSMRLLAYTIGDLMVGARLDVKKRIFAMGATSLKIGHTLLRILNEQEEDAGIQPLQGRQASMILVDRTSDLASPCSFGDALLDRILTLLPQTPTPVPVEYSTIANNTMGRARLHATEIYPILGCDPTPLIFSTPNAVAMDKSAYFPSEFVSQIQWRGGASLCHPTIPSGSNAFRSLAFRPAKLALRDLDRRLQTVEHALLQEGVIQKTPVIRKPGEKPRGRDVVLRRINKILEAGEPTNAEHSSLIELGVIVLETLERMEQLQSRWEKCHERATRQRQLWNEGGSEWIIPELVDAVQRQLSATSAGSHEDVLSLQELLTLLVQGFALSSGANREDFTVQMVQKAVVDKILQVARTDPECVQSVLPGLFEQLVPYCNRLQADQTASGNGEPDADDNDWDWTDGSNSPKNSIATGNDVVVEAQSVIESQAEVLMSPLKDCAQQFVKISSDEPSSSDSPRSLIAQLCNSVVNPTGLPIPELEHVVDVSEQLTRAGIDLLKSGFSKFGLGGSGGTQRGTIANRLLGESTILVVFVVGGITFEEIQEVHDALQDNMKCQIILGGTTITNNEIILEKLFS